MVIAAALSACAAAPVDGNGSPLGQIGLPNPTSVYCQGLGYVEETREGEGGQYGVCIFPDGSECDAWDFLAGRCGKEFSYCSKMGFDLQELPDSNIAACVFPDGSQCPEFQYFQGECSPAEGLIDGSSDTSDSGAGPTEIATALPINSADYLGWWTYTHPAYGFSVLLPEDWVVEDITTGDDLMNGHLLMLHPEKTVETQSIRMTFRRTGEDVLLWPTGVGEGEFINQETLDIAGQPAQRMLLVCPGGDVTSIWYHDGESQPNISRGDMEFAFIYSAGEHCASGLNLIGKTRHLGEMIIASLALP